MSDKLDKFLENIIPYIVVGIGIALIIALLFMFFYIAIWGIVIGAVLWIAALVKQHFFPGNSANSEQGRVIEHDDKK